MRTTFTILFFTICTYGISTAQTDNLQEKIDSLKIQLVEGSAGDQFQAALQLSKWYRDSLYDYKTEFIYLTQALPLAESQSNFDKEMALVYLSIGANYFNRTKYDSSSIAYEKAQEYYSIVKDTSKILLLEEYKASNLQQQNRIPEALEVYHNVILRYEAMNSFDGLYNSRVARVNVAYMQIAQKEYQSAIEYLMPCFDSYLRFLPTAKQRAKMKALSVNYNMYMGQALEKSDQLEEAQDYFQACLKVSREIKYPFTEAHALIGIGNYKLERSDDIKAAMKDYQNALQILTDVEYKPSLIVAHLGLSHAYAHLRDYDQSIYHDNEAIRLSQEMNQYEGLREGHNHLAAVYEDQGDYKHAYEHLVQASQAKDSLISEEKVKTLEKERAFWGKRIQDLEISRLNSEKKWQLAVFLIGLIAILAAAYYFFSRHKLSQARKAAKYEKQVSRALNKFVPKSFLKTIGREHILEVQLGDQVEEEVTIVFTDIRSFTTISERMSPSDNFKFVKRYAEQMGPIIVKHGGFINQYLGDGIMAIFQSSPDAALRACIEMQEAVQLLNEKTKIPLRVGMGLHTGTLVMGIIGDETRQDAALISDAVNTAARLESLTKPYGVSILLSEASYRKIEELESFDLRYLGRNHIKGKQEQIRVYECISGIEEADDFKLKLQDTFDKALQLAEEESYDLAKTEFEEIINVNRTDSAAVYLLEQIEKKMI